MSFAILGGTAAGGQARAQEPLLHRESRLYLPALPVVRPSGFPVVMPESAVESSGTMIGAVTGPSAPGRDDAEYAQAMEEAVVVFAVVTDVTGQGQEPMPSVSLTYHGVKLDVVGFGSAVHDGRQGQVRASVHHLGNLGISAVLAPAPLAEIGRNVPGFQAGGVHGGQFMGVAQQAVLAGMFDAGVEQTGKTVFLSSR